MTMVAHSVREPDLDGASPSRTRLTRFRFEGVEFAVLSVALDGEDVMAELSSAERVIATLAAAGLTNVAIAKCRGKSVHTVANQVASIFRKLRVGSRYELAARLAPCPVGTSEP
jgi:DNA-binding CsgD family transcriptional regulator